MSSVRTSTRKARSTRAGRDQPRLAVLLPVYNSQSGLEATLRSFDRQDYDFDVLVVDDGSEPALTLSGTAHRKHVEILRLSKNSGIQVALNEGLKKLLSAGYDYIARQDAGDLDRGERMQRQVDFLDHNPSVAVVGSWVEFTDTDGNPLYTLKPSGNPQQVRRRMRLCCAIIHPTSMFRAVALREVGLYSEEYPCAEDYDYFYRLITQFAGAIVEEVLVVSEVNPSGISIQRRKSSLKDRIRIQLKYFSISSPAAYWGVLRSIILLILPYGLIRWLKSRLGNLR